MLRPLHRIVARILVAVMALTMISPTVGAEMVSLHHDVTHKGVEHFGSVNHEHPLPDDGAVHDTHSKERMGVGEAHGSIGHLLDHTPMFPAFATPAPVSITTGQLPPSLRYLILVTVLEPPFKPPRRFA